MQLNLRRNTIWAVAEVIGSGVTLFLLFKIVVDNLGVASIGIWSLVLATTALGRMADLGLAAGLSRFVAATQARADAERALPYVETALIANFLLYAGITILLAAPAFFGLALVMNGSSLDEARRLLPFSLVSFILMGATSATTGAIVGQHRSDHKSMITMAGLGIQFSVVLLLVPRFGLLALAWAQIAQYLFVLVAGWILFLKNHFGVWTVRAPVHWHKNVVHELLGFGVRLQAASFASMIWDPAVKFLMSSAGGLEVVGFFEMAQRLIIQVRQLVVMPNQTLVPSFSHLLEVAPEQIGQIYHQAAAFSVLFGFPLMLGVAVSSPVICYIWIGTIEPTFVILTAILCVGWFVNIVSAPAYLLGVGTGRVKWNFYGAVLTTAGSCVLGIVLGHAWGGIGVAIAASTMQAAGSVMNMAMNCRIMGITAMPGMADYRVAVERVSRAIRKLAL